MRVLLVDDDPLVRLGLRAQFAEEDAIEMVGEAADGLEALEQVASVRPEVVLLDLRMPRMGGLAAIAALKELDPRVKVVVLTAWGTDAEIREALVAGADGFLLKDCPPSEMARSLEGVVAGRRPWSDPVADTVVESYTARARRGKAARDRLEPLSDLERTVAELIAEGLSNSEIAARRYASVSTVKATIGRVFDKLGCSNRVQVAAVVLQARDG